ncbi:hypothetical protein F4779DRAFT_607696 [Xylariaceae sp. FL0662B]|nr:hypothetical protein F4779DRAFT_607696 [Xylariaceae sp. FL0662B]
MASPNPPPPPTTTPPSSSPSSTSQPAQAAAPPPPATQAVRNPVLHTVALGVTPIALGALLLPPRKFDLRFVILGGVALWGGNRLASDYLGVSGWQQRLDARMKALTGTELPEKARETQLRLRAERAARLEDDRLRSRQQTNAEAEAGTEAEEGDRGILEKIWMGDQGDDWKEKRERREKEALAEGGGGYWGLITDQISEVWNWGSKKGEEGREEAKSKQGKEDSDSKKT